MGVLEYVGYCAGIKVVEGSIDDNEKSIKELEKEIREKVKKGELFMKFGSNSIPASEVCVDFYRTLDGQKKFVQNPSFNIKK
jgi:cell fate regulator YaaT (PSP1 superfamily)